MRLPRIDNAPAYAGLYIYDFGEWSSVGYTADEIAVLREQPEYRGGHIYRIVRARPDGYMELKGVSAERFEYESAMFFYRNHLHAARRDFSVLTADGLAERPPCGVTAQLAHRRDQRWPYATVLIYRAEHEEEVAAWLLRIGFHGGESVEGGVSTLTRFREESNEILERCQLWNTPSQSSRSPEQVLENVRAAVQR